MSTLVPGTPVPTSPSNSPTSADSATAANPAKTTSCTFADLGLSPAMLQAVSSIGYTDPTPIQRQAIPAGLQGRDVIGCAQTGTGKTAAFAIPLIERLANLPKGTPHGLILAPTRELAIQIQETIDKLGKARRVFATTVVGGADMQAQVRGLRQRPEIVVATPGRLLDHMWNGTVNLGHLTMVVLDEADRMLDMGFAPQLNQILDALPEERQTLLFSATMPVELGTLVRGWVRNPVRVEVAKPASPASGVTHTVHHTTQADKTSLLLRLMRDPAESVLVFTRTKHRADRLTRALEQRGHQVAVLHGNRSLPQRRAALEGFRRGRVRVLVATDIAARGLDVPRIGHVINYDLPNVPEDYVHRIGRTGRMEAIGRATSFVTSEDSGQLRAIERLLGKPVPRAAGSQAPASHAGGHPSGHARREGPPGQGRPVHSRPARRRGPGGPHGQKVA